MQNNVVILNFLESPRTPLHSTPRSARRTPSQQQRGPVQDLSALFQKIDDLTKSIEATGKRTVASPVQTPNSMVKKKIQVTFLIIQLIKATPCNCT